MEGGSGYLRPLRGVDKFVRVVGAGMLLSAYMQIHVFGYSPLKIQRTAILLDRANLKTRGTSVPLAPPGLHPCHLE